MRLTERGMMGILWGVTPLLLGVVIYKVATAFNIARRFALCLALGGASGVGVGGLTATRDQDRAFDRHLPGLSKALALIDKVIERWMLAYGHRNEP